MEYVDLHDIKVKPLYACMCVFVCGGEGMADGPEALAHDQKF